MEVWVVFPPLVYILTFLDVIILLLQLCILFWEQIFSKTNICVCLASPSPVVCLPPPPS